MPQRKVFGFWTWEFLAISGNCCSFFRISILFSFSMQCLIPHLPCNPVQPNAAPATVIRLCFSIESMGAWIISEMFLSGVIELLWFSQIPAVVSAEFDLFNNFFRGPEKEKKINSISLFSNASGVFSVMARLLCTVGLLQWRLMLPTVNHSTSPWHQLPSLYNLLIFRTVTASLLLLYHNRD